MVFITAEAYKNAGVHTITEENKDYFWVKMKDLSNRICEIYEIKSLTKSQRRK